MSQADNAEQPVQQGGADPLPGRGQGRVVRGRRGRRFGARRFKGVDDVLRGHRAAITTRVSAMRQGVTAVNTRSPVVEPSAWVPMAAASTVDSCEGAFA